VTLRDEKVEQPALSRFISCRHSTAQPGEAEALETLLIARRRTTSALYDALVVEEQVAVGAGAYMGSAVDDTRLWVYATPAPDVSLQDLDVAIDRVLRAGEEPIDAEHCSAPRPADRRRRLRAG
jgi:zinc protease